MPCEKYSGWMTDAALGELRAEREPELLAHAMECDACREALSHARAVHDFVDRGVESLVAGEPSPHFATNLRRRIAQESESRRSRWMAWAPVLASALALAVVLAIMVARISRHAGATPNGVSDLESNPGPADAVIASIGNPHDADQTAHPRDRGRSARTRAAITALPEIMVPRGQLSAAAQLSAAISSGRVDGNQLLAVQRESERPLEVKPIEIAPLEFSALADATE
jgi:hypothetical protein